MLAEDARRELLRLADQPVALAFEAAADDEQRRGDARAPLVEAAEAGLRSAETALRDPGHAAQPGRQLARLRLERGHLGPGVVDRTLERCARVDRAADAPFGRDDRVARPLHGAGSSRAALLVAAAVRLHELALRLDRLLAASGEVVLRLGHSRAGGGKVVRRGLQERGDADGAVAEGGHGPLDLADLRERRGEPLVPTLQVACGRERAFVRHAASMPVVELEEQVVEVAGRELRLLVPPDAEALLDEEAFEHEEFLPYWAELWPSGLALGDAVASCDVSGARVVELGCGLGIPSLAAALTGASVLATDWSPDAIELLRANAERHGITLEAEVSRWTDARLELERAPWDLVLAADVLYERRNADLLLGLLPRLGTEVLLADPGRPHLKAFLERAARAWRVERDGTVYRLRR